MVYDLYFHIFAIETNKNILKYVHNFITQLKFDKETHLNDIDDGRVMEG
jgi:hypothetical protein